MATSEQPENPVVAHSMGTGCIISTESWEGPWAAAGLKERSDSIDELAIRVKASRQSKPLLSIFFDLGCH